MKKLYDKLVRLLFEKEISIEEAVEYSLKKYQKTYKLLEQYDKKDTNDSERVVDPAELRSSIQKLQAEAEL